MPSSRWIAVSLFLLALAVPSIGECGVAAGLRLSGGYDRFSMGDWNDILSATRVTRYPLGPTHAGHSLGAGVEILLGSSWSALLGYERLVPARREDLAGREIQLRANSILLSLEARRDVRSRLSLGVGAGVGYYLQGQEVEARQTGVDLEGDGFGGQATALADWTIRPGASAELEIGYRRAIVDVSKVNHQPPRTDIEIDYSGFITRLTLRLHPPAR